MSRPKVSICIPTYNAAQYLGESISSALSQTYQDIEVIVCDNASTDGTYELCKSIVDSRLLYYRFDDFVGQGANWNRCIARAHGEYIGLLHADDWYYPDFVTERTIVLDNYPSVGLAFGAVKVVNEENEELRVWGHGDTSFIVNAPNFYHDLLFGCVISPVSPLVRRICYEAVGRFDESRWWGIDWEMWLKIAASFGVAYSPHTHAAYRIHGKSGSSAGLTRPESAVDDYDVLVSAFRRTVESPDLARFTRLRRRAFNALAQRSLFAASHCLLMHNRKCARLHLRNAIRSDYGLLIKPTFLALWWSFYLGNWWFRTYRRIRDVYS